MTGFTVIELARELRVELSTHDAWAIGAGARGLYEAKFGELPPKELRPKTSGGGTHCFAVYPPSLKASIAALIRERAPATSSQSSLF